MRNEPLIKQLTAVFMAICLTIGSIGMLPATAYADSEGADTSYGFYEGAEYKDGKDTGDTSPSASDTYDIDKKVAELLAGGEYLEGRAIVLYDTESPASDEELVGAGSLIAGAEQIAEVSAESYVNATGETLEISEEELVGSASGDDDARIAVLVVEDRSRSTEDLLRELLADPRVLSAEPDYTINISDIDSTGSDDEVIETFSSFTDEESDVSITASTDDLEAAVDSEGDADTSAASTVDLETETVPMGDADTCAASTDDLETAVDSEGDADSSAASTDDLDISVPPTEGTDAGTAPEDADLEELTPPTPEPEALVGASGDLTPYQWGMSDGSNRYSQDFLKNKDVYGVNSPNWNMPGTTNSEGVIVIIDSGIDHTHPDLKDSMYAIPDELQKQLGCGKYGISVTNVRDVTDTSDQYAHGTYCAGIAAASWNGEGVSGVASGAKLMAVRCITDFGRSNYADLIKAYEFVKKAKESGIDIRATSNSFGFESDKVGVRALVEELGKHGIICVYASGNDNSNVNPMGFFESQLWDLPNVVLVNSSTIDGEKAPSSSFSQNETHIFAPGENILSTIPIKSQEKRFSRSYFTELDKSPLYTDPAWSNFTKDMTLPVMEDWMEDSYWDYVDVFKANDISSCGRAPAVCIKILKDVPAGSSVSACFLLPVAKDASLEYVSADICAPGKNVSAKIRINVDHLFLGKYGKGNEKNESTPDWIHVNVTELSDGLLEVERYNENYVPVYVDINKSDKSSLKAGDCVYIDNLSMGSDAYNNEKAAYGIGSGTSCAAPLAAGLAAVLYKGKTVNRENASLVTAKLKGMVRQKDSLAEYCTSGGVLSYTDSPDRMLPVMSSAHVNDTDLTIIVDGYFFGQTGEQCNVNLAGNDLEIVSWDENRVIVKLPSAMVSGLQKITLTNADGLSTRDAFYIAAPPDSEITDTATPLYETTLPDIPTDVIGIDEEITGVCGLLDTLYFIVSKMDDATLFSDKFVSYSLQNREWKVLPAMPYRFFTGNSMTAYQGAIYINGHDEKGGTHLISYLPDTGKWTEMANRGKYEATIINFNNRLLLIGGRNPEDAGKVRQVDISTDPATFTEIAGLDMFFSYPQAAAVGNTLYLYGGKVGEHHDDIFSENTNIYCYTFDGQKFSRDRDKETEVNDPLAPEFSKYDRVICASDKDAYLTGAYMKEGVSGTFTDPSDYRISDGDTWILKKSLTNLGKRLSHTIVKLPRATVYKGILYGFGITTQDGDPLKYLGRATVVDENPKHPIQDIMKVKIPTAIQGLEYNGKARTGVPESKDGSYTVRGNKKTEPGTYKAVVSLTDTDRFMWEDGTTESKTITWSISTVPVTGVKLNKTELTLYVGSSAGLSATVLPKGAYDKAVTWKSTDPKIAKVDADGKVTGVKAGTVKVTVTTKDGKKTADCTVKVITGVPVYRLYNIKGNGDHLFTTSAFEKNVLSIRGWKYEGVAWYEPKESTTPVYRSYNPNNGYHMYTCSKAERAAITKAGWKQEGIAFYSCREGSRAPVYRLYNPNSGEHFFTNTNAEKNMLIKAGWKYEGIGFYALNFTKN